MQYLLVAFLSPLFFALAGVIESRLSTHSFKQPITMIFYVSIMNAVFMPLVFFFGWPQWPESYCWIYYFILGLIDVVYLYPYYIAFKGMQTSIVEALFALGQVVIPVLTYFMLHEELRTEQYFGFAVIILASVFLSINDFKMPRLNRAFYLMFGVSVLRAVYVVLQKYTLELDNNNWINLAVYPALVSGTLPLLFLWPQRWRCDIIENFPRYRQKLKFFITDELASFIAETSMMFALSGISAVYGASISATQPIFALVISWFFCKHWGRCREDFAAGSVRKKMIGFLVIIWGVSLVIN